MGNLCVKRNFHMRYSKNLRSTSSLLRNCAEILHVFQVIIIIILFAGPTGFTE